MAVGGPPWLNGAAVRAGFATVSAVVAVLLAWAVARLDVPILHAVVWPLYGLSLVAVGRMVWRDTRVEQASTVAVAVETMMIVVGVACALMGATAALGSPADRAGGDHPKVLGDRIGPGSTTTTTGGGVDQASLAAGAGLSGALTQFGAGGLVPSSAAAPSTSVAPSTSTTLTVTPSSATDAATTTTVAPGAVRVTTTTRPPVIGTPTTIRRGTTTAPPTRTVPGGSTTVPPPTDPPTTPATTTPATTAAPTTPATTVPATTVAPTTTDPPPTTAAPG